MNKLQVITHIARVAAAQLVLSVNPKLISHCGPKITYPGEGLTAWHRRPKRMIVPRLCKAKDIQFIYNNI